MHSGVDDARRLFCRGRNIRSEDVRTGFAIGGVVSFNEWQTWCSQAIVLKKWVSLHGAENCFFISRQPKERRAGILLSLQMYEEYVQTGLDLGNVIFCDDIEEKAAVADELSLDIFVDGRADVLAGVARVSGIATVVCFDDVDDRNHRQTQCSSLQRIQRGGKVQLIWTTRKTGWDALWGLLPRASDPIANSSTSVASFGKRKLHGCALCCLSFVKLTECVFCASHICKDHAYWCTMKTCDWLVCATCQKDVTRTLIQRGNLWLCPDHLWRRYGEDQISAASSGSQRNRKRERPGGNDELVMEHN